MVHRMTIGAAEITALTDSQARVPVSNVYAGVEAAAVEPYREFLDEADRILLNFTAYLLRVDGKTILIDTGVGPGRNGRLPDELAAAGVSPDDIDIVAHSHLHGDHYGWSLVEEGGRFRARFPNARHLVPRTDWDWLSGNTPGAEASWDAATFATSFAPIESLGVMDLVDPGHAYTASLTSQHTPGHTPGHLSFVLRSGGETCVVLGDVAFNPIDAAEPAWRVGWDEDPDVAVETRVATLARLEADGSLVATSHFPPPTFGRFVREDGRRRWRVIASQQPGSLSK